MRTVRLIFASLLTLALCLIVSALPSQAQGIHYEVEEHTTNQRISGWERTLTQRDPNLNHWHWEPITKSAHNIDVKKIVDPTNPTASVSALKYAPTHYIKPIHVPFPTIVHNGTSEANANSTADLAGKLMRKNNGAPITAQARPAATYSDYARPEFSAVSTAAARANVVGNIIHKSGRHSACNETPKYF